METSATKPVIFLAFANDREDRARYLRNLAEEARQLHATLDQAAQAGLCEVLLRQNVTLETLLDIFQDARYRNRIAIFHYGGHAASFELLLETAAGKTAVADAGGLAAFLGRQTGMQLVFLNGCSSQPQAQGLLDAGVAAVIATAQAIDDAVATDFAVRFYKGLAGGAPLQTAFHEAEAACQTARGNQPRHLYFQEMLSDSGAVIADRWPWALTPRPGAEMALQWNLPDAVNDPLFDLPSLPALDLPASPYRYLNWYRREDAEVFFGRGYDIRELYQRITAPDAPPITLYYGQSGVGKSSLLAAGLLPRLEQVQTVIYARRDQALGLVGALATSLPGAQEAPLLARWRAHEAKTGKPLTIILDQVEEVYTRPNADLPGEMDDFLDALTALFSDRAMRPQGRLILSFRKEWLAEIEKLVAERQLPRAKVFLQRLDRRGIIETVTGPARSERLRQHFGLTVADDLAGEIADDLLSDPSSAVATTLQILLSKLWEQAKARDYDSPTFDRALYHDLRRQGLLLNDFLDQQLAALHATQPAVVESGLVLDLLAFHTTPLGTAEQRALAELRATYAHQEMTLPDLLGVCRNLYLLVDPAENRPDAEPASRLAHDTLAPLVRHRFDESDAPGQRARRVLESRLNATDGAPQATEPLGEADLALIESGQAGMRAWREPEMALVDLSRAARERRRKRDRIIRAVLIALVCMIAVTAGIAVWQWGEARVERDIAVSRGLAAAALNPDLPLDQALLLSLAAFQPSDTREAAASLLSLLQANYRAKKVIHVFGGSTGPLDMYFSPDGKILATCHYSPDFETVFLSLWDVESSQQIATPLYVSNTLWTLLAFSPDSKTIAFVNNAGGGTFSSQIFLWDIANNRQIGSPLIHEQHVDSVAFDPDGKTLAYADRSGTIFLRDIENDKAIGQPFGDAEILSDMAFSPDGKTLAVITYTGNVTLWDLEKSDQPISQPLPEQKQTETATGSVEFTPEGRTLIIGSGDAIRRWDMTKKQFLPEHTVSGWAVLTLDGSIAAIPSSDDHLSDRALSLWNVERGESIGQPFEFTDHFIDVAFSPDGKTLAVSTLVGYIILYDIEAGQQIGQPLLGHYQHVSHIVFSPDGKIMAVSSRDGQGQDGSSLITLWDLASRQPIGQPLIVQGDEVLRLMFSLDSKALALGSLNAPLRLWDIGNDQPIVQPLFGSEYNENAGAIAFSSDGKIIAIGQGGAVRLWDIESGQPIGPSLLGYNENDYVGAIAFSSDNRTLAVGYGTSIRLWDVKSGQPIGQPLLGHEYPVHIVAFSPNGKLLASGNGGVLSPGSIRLWDVASGQQIGQPLSDHKKSVTSIAFSPDGKTLASGSEDKTIRLWDVKSGQRIGEPFEVGSEVSSLVFSPDGKTLVSGSWWDTTVRLWDVDIESWKARACSIANRNLTQAEWQQYLGDEPYRKTCPDLP